MTSDLVSKVEEQMERFGLDGRVEKMGSTIYIFQMPDEERYRFDGIRPRLGFAFTEYEWENGMVDMEDLNRKLAETRGYKAFYEGGS